MRKPDDAFPKAHLRSARESQGWTQEELAEKLGTTSVTISRWESGVTFPSRHFRRKLSVLYGISIADLGLLQEKRRKQEPEEILPVSVVVEQEPSRQHVKTLFFFNEPLLTPQECYGRRRERETLLNRTYRHASTSIVGPRRIGKTWLASYLRLMAEHEFGTRFHIGYLDATMPSCQSASGFAAEALEALGLPNNHATGLISLEKGLKLLKTKQETPVLCIDEFEGMGKGGEFSLDFFRGLRAMTQTFGLVLIVISRQPISAIIGKDMETSGFFNIFEQIILEPFRQQEAEAFIAAKSRQAGFGAREIEALWHYAELSPGCWPPLRLQLVGKLLTEEPINETEHFWLRFEQRLEALYREVVY